MYLKRVRILKGVSWRFYCNSIQRIILICVVCVSQKMYCPKRDRKNFAVGSKSSYSLSVLFGMCLFRPLENAVPVLPPLRRGKQKFEGALQYAQPTSYA